MKSFALAIAVAFAAASLLPTVAEARRIGGGGAIGMQRSLPPRATPVSPAAPVAPTAPRAVPPTTAAAPAVAPKRSWLGPIAGLAAGLGIAALMSHLGFGAEFGNFLMLALLAIAAVFVIRLLMRRFATPRPAAAGMQFAGASAYAGGPSSNGAAFPAGGTGFARVEPVGASAAAAPSLPADFDVAAFGRIARMIFIRMQTANDSADLADLRSFTTPEMFAAVRLDLQERGNAEQTTDVVRVDAEVLEVAREEGRQIVSVRFSGLIREEASGPTEPFDEVWHLVRPDDGSRDWAIAGIQPAAAPLARAA